MPTEWINVKSGVQETGELIHSILVTVASVIRSNSFGPKNNLLDCLGKFRDDNIEMFLMYWDGTGT